MPYETHDEGFEPIKLAQKNWIDKPEQDDAKKRVLIFYFEKIQDKISHNKELNRIRIGKVTTIIKTLIAIPIIYTITFLIVYFIKMKVIPS